jgi:hypothetical protein
MSDTEFIVTAGALALLFVAFIINHVFTHEGQER